ncbi:MAG: DUF4493 domain-containing protein [Bacteroidaceae bacterium]|nr:DUF4493 domain-containing protein [Bacteroidaceae bacterium]
MRLHKYILCAAAATLGTVSCTTNNPWDSEVAKSEYAERGLLNLNISAKTPESRTASRAAVNTASFHVTIKGNDDDNKGFSTDYYVEEDGEKKQLQLPVGKHTITATNHDRLDKQMTVPVYVGTKEIEITKDITTETEVACKMANSRVSVGYTDKFRAIFDEWEITINDNSDKAITYDQTTSKSRMVFWLFENNCEEISVDIKAHTKAGVNVEGSAKYNKKNSTEQYTDLNTNYFCGGDAIEIEFSPAEATSGDITGININTKIEFTNEDQDVVVEVTDKIDEPIDPPTPPSGDPIVVEFPYGQEFTATAGQTEFDKVQVDFTFPTGLKNLYVSVSGSEGFEDACSLMGLTEGDGLDLTGDEAQALGTLFNLPTVGDTKYTFNLNDTLWDLLLGFPGTQTFTLKAVDKNGTTANGTLTITINE